MRMCLCQFCGDIVSEIDTALAMPKYRTCLVDALRFPESRGSGQDTGIHRVSEIFSWTAASFCFSKIGATGSVSVIEGAMWFWVEDVRFTESGKRLVIGDA